jgi:hypothetical protein
MSNIPYGRRFPAACCRVFKPIIFCVFFLLVFVSHSYSGHIQGDEITIVFPAVTLSRLVNGVLPIKFGPNDNISGDIWIESIRNLKLEKDKVICSMSLHGKDVKYALQIEGSSVIVEIGDVDTAINLEGTFRFEKASNTFYLKPRILADDTAQTDGSPMKILLSFMSGIEYPIEVRNLKPIIAQFSGQEIRIDSSISDIFSDKNKLFFIVNPKMAKTETRPGF